MLVFVFFLSFLLLLLLLLCVKCIVLFVSPPCGPFLVFLCFREEMPLLDFFPSPSNRHYAADVYTIQETLPCLPADP